MESVAIVSVTNSERGSECGHSKVYLEDGGGLSMQCGVHPYYGYSYYGYTYLLAALKTEVVSACGGLRSVSSMAVMPRLHKSTLTGAGGAL